MREVIARIVDGSRFQEFKELYAPDPGLRVRPDHGLPGGHPGQQRRPLLRELAQGRPFHHPVRHAQDPAHLPPEHHRLHRRQDSTSTAGSPRTAPSSSTPWPTPTCRSSRSSSAAPTAPATTPCAAGPTGRGCSGCGRTPGSASWAGSRRRTSSSRSRSRGSRSKGVKMTEEEKAGDDAAHPREIRGGGQPLLTAPPASGTTGSSTRSTPAPPSALGIAMSLNAPIPDYKVGIFRMWSAMDGTRYSTIIAVDAGHESPGSPSTGREVHNAFNAVMIRELARRPCGGRGRPGGAGRRPDGDGRVVLRRGRPRTGCARSSSFVRAELRRIARHGRVPRGASTRCPSRRSPGSTGRRSAAGTGFLSAPATSPSPRTEAKFGLSEVKIGLVPAAISPYVIRRIGESRAREYFLTGERFDARRAHRDRPGQHRRHARGARPPDERAHRLAPLLGAGGPGQGQGAPPEVPGMPFEEAKALHGGDDRRGSA